MKSVMFICYGNIMRSQIAEAYYNHLSHSHTATSAGTDSFTPLHYKRPADEVIQVMKEDGIDVSDKKVKQVTEEMVETADEIYVLTHKEHCPNFLLNSPKVSYLYVPDPYGSSLETFRKTRDLIKEKVKEIVK